MKTRAFSPIFAVLGFITLGFGLMDINWWVIAWALVLFGLGIFIDQKTKPKS